MQILPLYHHKKLYLQLLLLADEQENMIDRYLQRGEVFVLYDDGLKGICVVTEETADLCEIKNIAIIPGCQRKGYGKQLIHHLINRYRGQYRHMQVGTGDSLAAITFYEQCGFVRSHIAKNFFIDHYEKPIYEEGKQLIHMVYLKRNL